MLVEAILRSTPSKSTDGEPMVVNAGYRKSFFDGLNRYYVADDTRIG